MKTKQATNQTTKYQYLKKLVKKTTKTLRNKADRLLQELGRLAYDRCLVCGGEYSCLHHYNPKSKSNALRYDLSNCIPICVSCHLQHHTGNPDIHNTINAKMGLEWVEEIEWRKHNIKIKPDRQWYLTQIEILETMINAYK